MLHADRRERLADASGDQRRRGADVLQTEGDLGLDPAQDDLVLRILEDRGDGARELGGPQPPGVEPADVDTAREPPTVEVRDEAGERAEEGRLARSRRAKAEHE